MTNKEILERNEQLKINKLKYLEAVRIYIIRSQWVLLLFATAMILITLFYSIN